MFPALSLQEPLALPLADAGLLYVIDLFYKCEKYLLKDIRRLFL